MYLASRPDAYVTLFVRMVRNPLWDALREPSMTQRMVLDATRRLDRSIEYLVKAEDNRGERVMPYLSVNDTTLQGLVRLGSLDALGPASVLLSNSPKRLRRVIYAN